MKTSYTMEGLFDAAVDTYTSYITITNANHCKTELLASYPLVTSVLSDVKAHGNAKLLMDTL